MGVGKCPFICHPEERHIVSLGCGQKEHQKSHHAVRTEEFSDYSAASLLRLQSCEVHSAVSTG